MKFYAVACIVIAVFIHEIQSQGSVFDLFRSFRNAGLQIIGKTTSNARNIRKLYDTRRLQKQLVEDMPFLCNVDGMRSPQRPNNVNELRPGDIDVVGALGDSLTAANGAGATSVLEVYTENRGVSWSIGGQGTWRQFLTLPNILKEFNPNLIGYSLADSLSIHRESQFNVAEPVAMTKDLVYMSKQLIKRIKNDPRVDFQNDWKLVTILIGPNDFCSDMCFTDYADKFPELRRRRLERTLRNLRDNMPRTFVNLVLVPNIKVLFEFTNKPQICDLTHHQECLCLFGLRYIPLRNKYIDIMAKSQEIDEEIASRAEFNTDDFAVTLQPYTKDVHIPLDKKTNFTDYSYLSPDCFHFSQKTHAIAANAVWNNMMEAVGYKSTAWQEEYSRFLCPTLEHPYLYTARNSGAPLH